MNNFNYKFCRGAAVLLMATSLSGCGMMVQAPASGAGTAAGADNQSGRSQKL